MQYKWINGGLNMDEIKLELFPSSETVDKPEEIHDVKEMQREADTSLSVSSLSAEQQAMVKDFVSKIDITDSNLVITYGNTPQNKIAQFSDSVLNTVRTKDLGEAGKLLSELVVEIQNLDSGDEEKRGLARIFAAPKKSMDRMVANYSRAETNIDKIVSSLQNQRHQLLKDIEIFDMMYENNYNYFKELSLYIIAGNEKIKEVNEITLPAMRKKAEESGAEIDSQKYNDTLNAANRFEKKVHDLTLTRTISLQMAPQIRLIQNNAAQLVDKIQSSLVNSIPLWKNQMVIAMGLANAKTALEAQKRVTNVTNDLLRKNSEMLKQGSLEVARESETSIVSIDTIKKTNQDLLDTIYGIIDIQEKGRVERASATAELEKIENELKQALLATKGR